MCSIETLKTELGFRYTYKLDDSNFCVYSVSGCLISIRLIGYVPFEKLVESLKNVTKLIVEEGKVPQVSIFHFKSKKYSVILNMLRKSGYKCIKSSGVNFSIWTYTRSSL